MIRHHPICPFRHLGIVEKAGDVMPVAGMIVHDDLAAHRRVDRTGYGAMSSFALHSAKAGSASFGSVFSDFITALQQTAGSSPLNHTSGHVFHGFKGWPYLTGGCRLPIEHRSKTVLSRIVYHQASLEAALREQAHLNQLGLKRKVILPATNLQERLYS